MRRVFVVLFVCVIVLLSGCRGTAPNADVVNGVEVLRDNTVALSRSYSKLLDRSSAPEGMPESEWQKHVLHQRLLMTANNKLADKIHQWAKEASQEERAAEE